MTEPCKPPIGIIGIGNMGFALLQRLRAQGWLVVVHDIDPQRCAAALALGATVVRHAAEVAQHCRQTLVVVVDAAQTAEVLWGEHGLHCQAQAGDVVWLCPTLGPQDVEAAAERLAALGVSVMDAPMSGGPLRAQRGEMSLMLAGPAAVLSRVWGIWTTPACSCRLGASPSLLQHAMKPPRCAPAPNWPPTWGWPTYKPRCWAATPT
ncbi:MAG: hypothetical protein C4K60_08570 [Ideonella sp. MAG2]|nr:MAG: hypothetical protein C4K60_08570 [Ideonella sp. MAG2]